MCLDRLWLNIFFVSFLSIILLARKPLSQNLPFPTWIKFFIILNRPEGRKLFNKSFFLFQVPVIFIIQNLFFHGLLWMKSWFQRILNLEIMFFLLDGIANKLHKFGMLVQALEFCNLQDFQIVHSNRGIIDYLWFSNKKLAIMMYLLKVNT